MCRSPAGAGADVQVAGRCGYVRVRARAGAQVDGGCGRVDRRRVRGSPAGAGARLTCEDRRGRGRAGAKSASSYAKVVKNPFSWKFHFSAYNVCPDKSFWRGKKSS